MFAVIKSGGKQYKVATQDMLIVEKLPGEAGDGLVFENVLMLGGDKPAVGAPFVDGASVAAEIVEQSRSRKIIVFKKRRRKNSRRKNGHRQYLTTVRITDILTDGKKATVKKAAAKPAAKSKTEAAAEKPAPATDAAAPADKAAPADTAVPLFDTPAGAPDDLKKISGVGPVLEIKLHDLGITKFGQVAAFTPDDVTKVDDALSFKGRIDRDDWISQAKILADETKED